MKGFGGVSRRELFERLEKSELGPLPAHPFEPAEWSKAKVHEDYHVAVNRHWYSVPYELIGQVVEVRLTAKTLEAYWKGSRVATHVRCDEDPFRPSTNPAHRPPKHRALFEEGRDRLMTWARDIGPAATELMTRFLDPAHNFAGIARRRSDYGLRKLGETYEPERIEEACFRALGFERVSYKSVERTLRLGLDLVPLPEASASEPAPIEHEQVRGAAHFACLCGPTNLEETDAA